MWYNMSRVMATDLEGQPAPPQEHSTMSGFLSMAIAAARRSVALHVMRSMSHRARCTLAGTLIAAASVFVGLPAHAQVLSFEPPGFAGSAGGTPLAGQNGWATVPGAAVPFNVYTYAGHAFGFSANPVGAAQCIAGRAAGNNASAQLAINFAGGSLWRITFDIAVKFDGTLPAGGNPGSFSLQPTATSQSFRTLNRWTDAATADTWIAGYNIFDSAGTLINSAEAGPEWTDLLPNRWYRQSTLIDFNTNRVVEVSIIDLHSGDTATVLPVEWYLEGGAAPGLPRPTAIRCNINGAGNTVAWDNIRIEQVSLHSGLVHRAHGGAVLSRTPSGALRIDNIGSSGQDGVEVALPDTPEYGMEFDLDPAMPVGTTIRSTSRGTRAGELEVSPGSLILRRIASGFSAEADFGPSGSPQFTVVIRNRGTEVLRRDGLTGPAVELSTTSGGSAKMSCSCTWWRAKWKWIIDDRPNPNPPVEFRVAGQNVEGDEIEFLPTTSVAGFERMYFADTFISMPATGPAVVDRQWVRSRGIPIEGGEDTLIQTELVQLSLTSVSPIPIPTVDVTPLGAEGLANTMDLDPSMPAGARIEGANFFRDGATVHDAGTFGVERTASGLAIDADFAPAGSPTYTARALLNGVVVDSAAGLTGVGATSDLTSASRIEIRCWYDIPNKIGWRWRWVSGSASVSIAGRPPVFADEIEFLPDAPITPFSGDFFGRMSIHGMTNAASQDLAMEKYDLLHSSLGRCVIDGNPYDNSLALHNIGSSGEDGVEVRLTPELTMWDVQMSPPSHPSVLGQDATISMHTFGLHASGVEDKVSAGQFVAVPGGTLGVIDFSPVGATFVESVFSCMGTTAGSFGDPNPFEQWLANRWIRSICISIGRNYFDFHVSFPNCGTLQRRNGAIVAADYNDLATRGAVADIEHYTLAHLRAMNMERLVIEDEPQSTDPACYSDCDTTTGVGVLDIFDFLCFGNHFANGDSYACNCDLSTGPNTCDIFDFLCFGNDFALGCP